MKTLVRNLVNKCGFDVVKVVKPTVDLSCYEGFSRESKLRRT